MSEVTSRDGDGEAPAAVLDPAEGLARCMGQFHETFEASARRWELIVYPSLLAFIVLASYGFYLIFSLTNNIEAIAQRMGTIATEISHMQSVAANMNNMSTKMDQMSGNIRVMTRVIEDEAGTMVAMLDRMDNMRDSMQQMNVSMGQMRYDVSLMGRNMYDAARPMNFMNSFMPW